MQRGRQTGSTRTDDYYVKLELVAHIAGVVEKRYQYSEILRIPKPNREKNFLDYNQSLSRSPEDKILLSPASINIKANQWGRICSMQIW